MWRAIIRQPDAVALTLLVLLVVSTLVHGLLQSRRRGRRDPRDDDTPAGNPMATTWPALIKKELLAALITLLLISWWAMALVLEVGSPVDPELTPALAKAPWFFIGVQEMLQYFDTWLAGAVLPLLMIFGLAALPYLDTSESDGDAARRGRPVVLGLTVALVLCWLLPMVIGLFFRGEHWIFHPVWLPPPIEVPLPRPLFSLADLLGLGSLGGHLLGGALCLGPFALLPLFWRRLRQRPWAEQMGGARFHITGALIILLAMVAIKVTLVAALDVRYLWITPWVRI